MFVMNVDFDIKKSIGRVGNWVSEGLHIYFLGVGELAIHELKNFSNSPVYILLQEINESWI